MLAPYARRRVYAPTVAGVGAGGIGLSGAYQAGRAAYGAYSNWYSGKKRAKSTPYRHPAPALKSNKSSVRKTVRSRRGRRGRKTKSVNLKKLSKRVSNLTRLANASITTLTHRTRDTAKVATGIGLMGTFHVDAVKKQYIEGVLTDLPHYDPDDPANLRSVNGNTGTFNKEIFIQSITSKLTVKNNFQIPMNVEVIVYINKEDTGFNPVDAWTGGLQNVGDPSSTSPLTFMSDGNDVLGNLWTRKSTKKVFLQPGASFEQKIYTKSFKFNPAYTDSHAFDYQDEFHASNFVIRLIGPLGHDSLASVGRLLGGLDYELDRTMVVKYDGGAKMKQVKVVDNTPALISGLVVSNKPIADQQGYSAV